VTLLVSETAVVPRAETVSKRVGRDDELVDALRRQEPSSAEHLITAYADRAYRLAISITGNPRDAGEGVQDAFVSVIRKIDTFRGESAFGSWLYRIVANASYQKRRVPQGRRTEISLDEVLPVFHEDGRYATPPLDWSATVDDPARQTDIRLAVKSAIAQLPVPYRAALVLHDVEGLSNVEVAKTLRVSVANAKSRVHRARLFVRKHLAEHMSAQGRRRRPVMDSGA
jgi:RNA polymerase sigma-70 factor (ECF subfamily)